ncbi:hypothetical protein SNE40_012692 [Patella caerulea]|uniref:G-protein coupled receptors family 1 profile domain-containing protein n=1 Tax=Patella caerulea TaxID=87958 RepID=A0AAN8JS65_PATCE
MEYVRLNDSDYLHDGLSIYEVYAPETVWVDRLVTPFMYAIGFPGNILSLIVWIQKRMRHSSGCYLAALALDDLIFLCLHVIYELQTTWRINVLNVTVVCQFYPVVYMAVQYLSPLLVLGFTVERYISICHPFKREKYCTTKRAKMVIIFLTLLTFSMSSIQGYFYTLDVIDANTTDCGPRAEVRRGGTSSLFSVWNICAEMCIFLGVPLTVLLLNMLVIRELRRLSRVETQQLHCRTQRTSATTIMLLAVSFYQIITTLPVTIVYILFFEFPPGSYAVYTHRVLADQTWHRHFRYVLAETITNEYGTTHYAFNIFIYLITGKMFRREIQKLLCCCKRSNISNPSEYTSLRSSHGRAGSTRVASAWTSVNGHNGTRNGKDSETKV